MGEGPAGALEVNEKLAAEVEEGLRQRRYSTDLEPVRIDFSGNEEMRVSHETIYKTLFVQGRGALRKELHACLRTGRTMRRAEADQRRASARASSRDMVMISDRPAEVADRAVPGHWEGDLIIGADSKIGDRHLVERTTPLRACC